MKLLLLLPLLLSACGTVATSKTCWTTSDCDYLEWHGGASPSLVMRGVRNGDATRSAGSLVGTALSGAAGLMAAHGVAPLLHP